jgi:4-hydroxy-tetrahydrodipicolinate reductase
MAKVRIAVAGAAGKMGRRILTLAHADSAFEIVGALEQEGTEVVGSDVGTLIGERSLGVKVESKPASALKQAQVLIDFTHASATDQHLEGALAAKTGFVIGTTGLSEKTVQALQKASERIPVLRAPNMSAGVNFLFELVTRAAEVLGDEYDIEINETHHRMKKDAPSGTALELARLIAKAKGWDLKKALIYGREGETGERKKGTLAIHALRGGDVVGDHTVSFFGNGEVLELTHRATSRDAFARGALLAAKFVAAKKTGLYNMRDVLRS